MKKLISDIKSFRGIKISLFELRANIFDGYGISIFIFHWDYFKKYLTGNTKYLFSINCRLSYDEGAKTLDIFGSLLFFGGKLYSKQLTPKKDRCDYCGDICYTTKFYKDNIPYCEDCNN